MKQRLFQYLLFGVFIVLSASYSLPGEWKLKNIDGESTNKDITLGIAQTVIQNGDIKYSLNFSNCHKIQYQVNVKQNFMWIDSNRSKETQESKNLKDENNQCNEQDSKLQSRIAQTLKKVFFFAIKSDLLVFVSPNGNDLFQFSRIKRIYLTNLTGTWLLDQIFWERASNSEVVVTKDNYTLCDGKLVAQYVTNHVDQIKFDIKKNDNCEQANLTKALTSVRYYRLKDTQLQLYNGYSVQVIQLIYKSGDGLKQQQQIVKEGQKSNGTVNIIESDNPAAIDNTVQLYLRTIGEIDKNTK